MSIVITTMDVIPLVSDGTVHYGVRLPLKIGGSIMPLSNSDLNYSIANISLFWFWILYIQ